MNGCKICGEKNFQKIEFNNLFIKTHSNNKIVHDYESRLCDNCGVVYQYPQISDENVTKHYETNFRNTQYSIKLSEDKKFDFPFQFETTGMSFQRFYQFHKIIENVKEKEEGLNFNKDNTFLDYGAYQGAFLYACNKIWGVNTIAYDHNDDGLKFAKNFLNISHIYKTKNILEDKFPHNVDLCSAIHVLEHLFDPLNFLLHVKKNILNNKGYVYIEVPSALTSEYNNPTHQFMFTKESLKNLFDLAGFKILHISEERIYDYKRYKLLKRHVQTSINCLASTEGSNLKNSSFNIGKKLINNLEKEHFRNSNKIYFIRFKKFLKEGIAILYLGFFVLLSFIFKGKFATNLLSIKNYLINKLIKNKK